MTWRKPTHNRGRYVRLTVIALGLVLLVVRPHAPRHFTAIVQSSQPGLYAVSRFVDGDTIVVNMQGKEEKVRFVGVDTPETHKPNTPVQCYGPAAAAHTKALIGSARVRLESDNLSTDRDRYDRLLRYVYLTDGTLVNENLIDNGFGFYYPYFPFSKADEFNAAQVRAQSAAKGLWGNCSPIQKGDGFVSNTAG